MSTLPILPVEQTSVTLPESKKTIKIRPITVREEQMLIMGAESDVQKDFHEMILQVVNNCIIGENKPILSLADFSYTYMKLREISKGTTTNINLKCQHCKVNDKPFSENKDFQLDKVMKMDIKSVSSIIKITDSYALQLKPITFDVYINHFIPNLEKNIRTLHYLMAIELLDAVLVNDENIKIATDQKKEIIDSLNQTAMNKVQEWFINQSTVYAEFEWKCSNCKKENKVIEVDLPFFFGLV